MNKKIRLLLFIGIPILYLLLFNETYIEVGSISFLKAVTATSSVDDVIISNRPVVNVFSPTYGLLYRSYLTLVLLIYLFTPALLLWLKDFKQVSFKSLRWMVLIVLIWYIQTMFSGFLRLGEFFYIYLQTTFFVNVLLVLIVFLLESFFLSGNVKSLE